MNRTLALSLLLITLWQGVLQACSKEKYSDAKADYWETTFLSIPNPERIRKFSRSFSSEPRVAGTKQDLDGGLRFLSYLQVELGITPPSFPPIYEAGSAQSRLAIESSTLPGYQANAWIDTYHPILNTYVNSSLEVIDEAGQVVWQADLRERTEDTTDLDAYKYASVSPPFHGLSANGTVEGDLVYAKYGRRQDFADLVAKGIDLNGKVVLCRNYVIFRGTKVKMAEAHGAAAVITYDDIEDDGVVTPANGYEVYPYGPARNPTSIQRGSVQFLEMYPGDPTTPGYPSYKNSTRMKAASRPSIPSLPLSQRNGKVLHDEIAGANRRVRLINHVKDEVTPIWNGYAIIPGVNPEEVVMLGGHRDAWSLGAGDPGSGVSSMAEVVHAFGVLLKMGWRPQRSIMIASWDAEEFGLVGSTEFGEDFREWVSRHVVAYVNVDAATSGSRFNPASSPILAPFVRQISEDLPHPTGIGSLWDATNDRGPLLGNRSYLRDHQPGLEIRPGSNKVANLGSGSDYTVFLDHLGIASTNTNFMSSFTDAVRHYHSVFDTHRFQELWTDSDFSRHVSIAKHLGLQILRLSSSLILPFNSTYAAYEAEAHLDSVEKLKFASGLGDVDLAPLRTSIKALQASSHELDTDRRRAEDDLQDVIRRSQLLTMTSRIWQAFALALTGRWGEMFASHYTPIGCARSLGYSSDMTGCVHLQQVLLRVQAINAKLRAYERGFISETGLKDRPFYRHLGVAPGKWLGYGATTFPGLTEAIDDRNSSLLMFEAARLKDHIDELMRKLR